MSESGKYFGKYRGTVTDNQDPSGLGRIKIKAPDALGEQESGWATPSAPYAGDGVGLFLIPPVDAHVWIEFELGDLDYPIWSGCFWDDGEAPASGPDTKILKTDKSTITIDDQAGSITIETNSGLKIVMDTDGIEINNGQGASVKLSGPSVSINDDALQVT